MRSLLRLRRALMAAGLLCAGLLAAAPPTAAQDLLDTFEERVTEFTLDNGLTFIVVERHDAPVVSFHTYVDVGSADEPAGQTGIAHMFEHMAFKGTTSIGTTDIEAEIRALDEEERAFVELRAERARGPLANPQRLSELETNFEQALEEAAGHVEDAEYDRLLQQAGAVGINASTWYDATQYFYSLPSNRLELWFATESDRFLNPVLREFYQERDVVMEERRMRVESSPQGRLLEEFLAAAFLAHPYGRPAIGYMSDLQNITRTEAEAFFDRYYKPANMTVAIVGDVDPAEVRRLAEQYFGRIPAGDASLPVLTEEPEQLGERRVLIEDTAQPIVIAGYHRPSVRSEEDVVYDVMADVLGAGRTSRLHRALVEEELALVAQAGASFPANKYANLFIFFLLPNQGVSTDTLEAVLYDELDRLVAEGVTDAELERAKTRTRAAIVRQLGSNGSVAALMTTYEAVTGDWRTLFRQLDAVEAVTSEDVQRVAAETFRRSNRTVGVLRPAEPGEAE